MQTKRRKKEYKSDRRISVYFPQSMRNKLEEMVEKSEIFLSMNDVIRASVNYYYENVFKKGALDNKIVNEEI